MYAALCISQNFCSTECCIYTHQANWEVSHPFVFLCMGTSKLWVGNPENFLPPSLPSPCSKEVDNQTYCSQHSSLCAESPWCSLMTAHLYHDRVVSFTFGPSLKPVLCINYFWATTEAWVSHCLPVCLSACLFGFLQLWIWKWVKAKLR